MKYGGESQIALDQVDVQKSIDENAKRGVKFTLKAKPPSRRRSWRSDRQTKRTAGDVAGTSGGHDAPLVHTLPAAA